MKAAEKPIESQNQVDLSEVQDEATWKRIMATIERHQVMWAGHLAVIKSPHHPIDVKLDTRPIKQLPCQEGTQRRELIDEHIDKILAAKVIDPTRASRHPKL